MTIDKDSKIKVKKTKLNTSLPQNQASTSKTSEFSNQEVSNDNSSLATKTPKTKSNSKILKQSVSLGKSTHAVGKRKTSVARVWVSEGLGEVKVNNQSFEDFFGPRAIYKSKLALPFQISNLDISKFNITISALGGGKTGFIDAIKLAISRCILLMNPGAAKALRDCKLLTLDDRQVESKKYGRRKARKKEQYSKR